MPVDRKNITQDEPQVSCGICMSEIPASVALSIEGDEYVQYVCGIPCHHKWKEQSEKNRNPDVEAG
ncbi:MAG TPA: DUF3330 domain-containing protein [Gammaproteobacteria bacterium]|nr:DUF3330 domain-containing protein [Gammaproteobacteria bacterium]